jgi:predicted N-formylglutamate amidohydrolase
MTAPVGNAPPASPLLDPDEPPAFEVVNPAGTGHAVLSCDHASPRLPRRLGDLGVSEADRLTHIGWDVGAALVARRLSALVDAPLVLSNYSRLAIDCNRPPGAPTSIPDTTGGVDVPGNRDLPPARAAERAAALFWPYHRAIEALLDARRDAGRPTCFVAVHSFTPVLLGAARPWRAALLYNRDRRLADLFRAALAREPDLPVGDNEPYRVTDGGDFGVPAHGERRGIPHVLFEIRQDEIDHPAGVDAWAARLAGLLREAGAALFGR